eukprot:NODE_97_length_20652_cov_0.832093.p9 type:complete len:268 gc:universal NODE_97_length_20652_cov_0.832093:10608-9805(-)
MKHNFTFVANDNRLPWSNHFEFYCFKVKSDMRSEAKAVYQKLRKPVILECLDSISVYNGSQYIEFNGLNLFEQFVDFLNTPTHFCLQHDDPEAKLIMKYSTRHSRKWCKKPCLDGIPIGNYGYCSLKYDLSNPNHYPDFLNFLLHRKVWKQNSTPKIGTFIKPADKSKRFTGQIFNGQTIKGPFWCSERLDMNNEFRLYCKNGMVVYQEKDATLPNLNIPESFHGTIDLAYNNDEIVLVEVDEAPCMTGWYGPPSEIDVYLDWIMPS